MNSEKDVPALTEREMWDRVWLRRAVVAPPRADWYPDRRFMELFSALPRPERPVVLEVGAGASRWLPFLARKWDADVWGIDYSQPGCDLARSALVAAGVGGRILERDLFDDAGVLAARFDIVFSFGLVEHFEDTAGVMGHIARFVRSGGLVVTIVPNMCGLAGVLQRLADREIYDEHLKLDPHSLAAAHRAANLQIVRSEWYGSYDPAVVNETRTSRIGRLLLRAWRVSSRSLFWRTFDSLRVAPEGRFLSPYVLCVARKNRS